MKLNEGNVDRTIRVAVGLALIAAVFLAHTTVWLGVIGLVLLATGLVGFCPVYRLIGIRTRPATA